MRPCSWRPKKSCPKTKAGALRRSAWRRMTSRAISSCGPTTTGMPGLMMPAFSPAMVAMSFPRNSIWASPTRWMMVMAGRGITLVASYLPPSPTSSTTASAGWREKARNIAAAVISKKVMGSPSLTRSTSSRVAQSSSSEISSPASRMRSWKRTRWGEIWVCTFNPCASSMAREKAQAEPLPLVPATWITGGNFRCGFPSSDNSRRMRSSARSIFLGCSANSRSRMAELRGYSISGLKELGNSGAPIAADVAIARRRDGGARYGFGFVQDQMQRARQRGAQLASGRHHVQHAVGKKIFRALEAFGQFLADGLGDNPCAGETDLRARLGNMDVAQHGVRGRDAAEGGIGEHHHIGQPRFLQHLQPDGGARHLHQGQHAFLHPPAARSDIEDKGALLGHRCFGGLDKGFAHRHAQRTGQEIEG